MPFCLTKCCVTWLTFFSNSLKKPHFILSWGFCTGCSLCLSCFLLLNFHKLSPNYHSAPSLNVPSSDRPCRPPSLRKARIHFPWHHPTWTFCTALLPSWHVILFTITCNSTASQATESLAQTLMSTIPYARLFMGETLFWTSTLEDI